MCGPLGEDAGHDDGGFDAERGDLEREGLSEGVLGCFCCELRDRNRELVVERLRMG